MHMHVPTMATFHLSVLFANLYKSCIYNLHTWDVLLLANFQCVFEQFTQYLKFDISLMSEEFGLMRTFKKMDVFWNRKDRQDGVL